MEENKKKEAAEAVAVAAFVRKEVGDWDDEAKSRARFKALSGQRSDWEPLYHFWRDLIVKVARHLRTFIIRPSHVNRLWFLRSGLSPLCLDRVLVEMHRAGDLLLPHHHHHPNNSRLRAVLGFLLGAKNDDNAPLSGDFYILSPLLEERALEVVNTLSENHWTSCCVITMPKFEDICGGPEEAIAVMDYLSAQGRAKLLTIKRDDPIQGVKVCLVPGADSSASDVDYNVLHLVWTIEKLEQQLRLIDQRYQKSRVSALGCLKDGNKRVALRYAAEMKIVSQSRERCAALLERVENVLQVITDAESSKKVADAMKSSTQAIKANQISVEEVEMCLQEVCENIDSLKQIDKALESTTQIEDDDDVEDEFNKLQLDIRNEEEDQVPTKITTTTTAADDLTNALSNLHLKAEECNSITSKNKSMSKEKILEAAAS